MKINIEQITVKSGRRPVDEKKVIELKNSINEIGLLNPITVEEKNERFYLVAGAHRLEAIKKLGLSFIECNVLKFENRLLSELAEIDENLIRNELHYLDRGKELDKRKSIYEELYPETKHNSSFKGNKFYSVDKLSNEQKTFAEDTAEQTGVNKRTIYREIERAKNIIDEAQEVIKEKDLPRYQADELAKLEPETQKEFVSFIANGTVKDVTEFKKQKNKDERILQNKIRSENNITELGERKYRIIYADQRDF